MREYESLGRVGKWGGGVVNKGEVLGGLVAFLGQSIWGMRREGVCT